MKKFLLFLSILPLFTKAQIITTIAGDGINSYSGDGGPATSADIWYPWGLATDHAGNTWFAGSYYLTTAYNNIRIINASGIVSSFAGSAAPGFSGDGGPATAALLNYPMGLAHDNSGNLFILDWYNYRVRKVNAAGIITTIAGNGINDYTGDGGPATNAALYAPYAITCDGSGNVFFGQFHNYVIRKIDASGIITTIAGNGSAGFSGDGGPATLAKMGEIYGLATDNSGNLYIADYDNNRIRKVNSSGIISTIAGTGIPGFSGDGGPATSADIYPLCLVIDTAGYLSFTDFDNSRVRRIDPSGTIKTVGGTGAFAYSGDGGPATAASLNYPSGIGLNPSDNIILTDWANYRLRLITFTATSLFFTHGHTQYLNLCVAESLTPAYIDTSLAAVDTATGLTDTWSVITPPSHGTLSAAYSMASTGGLLTPSGLSYTPASGYTGTDLFKVRISNGISYDTTTVNVIVNPYPSSGTISGTDTICPGQADTLSETSTGGYWDMSDLSISYISGTGVVTGLLPGLDTVIYTDSNFCGLVSARFPIVVKSFAECNTGTGTITRQDAYINIFPNPASEELFVSSIHKINQVEIFNLLGQTLYFRNCTAKNVRIDLNSFSSGIYILKINGTLIRKFIKE